MNGDPYKTWTTKSGVFWLRDLIPKLGPKRARVLVYGYNSQVASFSDDVSTDGILQHAENLASDLSANRSVSLFYASLHSFNIEKKKKKKGNHRLLTYLTHLSSYDIAPIVQSSSSVIH